MPDDQEKAAQLGATVARQVQGVLPLVREGSVATVTLTLELDTARVRTTLAVKVAERAARKG